MLVLGAIFGNPRWRYRERGLLHGAISRLLEVDGVEEAALMLMPVGPR